MYKKISALSFSDKILIGTLFCFGFILAYVDLNFSSGVSIKSPILLSLLIAVSRLIFAVFSAYVLLPLLFHRWKIILFFLATLASAFVLAIAVIVIYNPAELVSCVISATFFDIIIEGGAMMGLIIAVKYFLLKHQLSQLELKQKEAENNLLKLQISPHFYFNTLNNIYGLILKKSDKAADSVLQLSNIMEYVIYECNKEKITLRQEVKHLQNYIQLETLRLDDEQKRGIQLHFNYDDAIKITPMLLMPFVENVFKHTTTNNNNWIMKISLTTTNNELTLSTQNTCISQNDSDNISNKKNGIGIDNTLKRLEFAYPNSFNFKKTQTENEFSIELKINL